MTPLVPITMFGWIPVVIGFFAKFKPSRAVIIAFLSAWMFLPIAKYPLPGLPDYTKMSATCFGIFTAAFLFDQRRVLSFKPSLLDLPMICWCFCPLVSSLSNGLGLYDGLATVLRYIFTWGFPFIVGRLYFSSLEGLRDFALGILYGTLIYVPLCLFENIMSPQLHRWIYGYHQHDFSQTFRYGGWRPMVFMEHGLMVGVWMMSGALSSFWFWSTGTIKKIKALSFIWLMMLLFFTSLMARSVGAIALLFMGAGILVVVKKLKTKILVVCLILIPIFYISTRATGIWDGYSLQAFIAENISVERALSLWTRMENENILREKALERPYFGWGGWGRSRVYDETGKDITVTDGLWIIIFGEHGLVGLGLFTLSMLMPIVVFLKYYPVKTWTLPKVAPSAVLSILLGLYMVDNLLNAMINPVFTVIAGGLTGIKKEQDAKYETNTSSEEAPIIRIYKQTRFL
ncbi:MAG: hypothetical protein JW925_14150 [Syntrophaceae bacterium]|nr:hypothetical protein [Syntrophaceae bacterium]